MEKNERTLKLSAGRKEIRKPGDVVYAYKDEIKDYAVYYVVAGMMMMEYNLPGTKQLKLYLQPGTVFGLEEGIESGIRFSTLTAIEKTILYKWELNSFFENAEEALELAVLAIKSLSFRIRVLNAEYGGQLLNNSSNVETTSEEDKLANMDFDPVVLNAPLIHSHIRHTFHDKQILIQEGEIQKQVFWILNGEVFITKHINEKHKILAKLGKGELIGEMSFFDKSFASATAIANGDVQVMVFTKNNFNQIFFANSRWVKRLLTALSGRIISMLNKLYILNKEIFREEKHLSYQGMKFK